MESFAKINAKQETASNAELHERFIIGAQYYLDISRDEAVNITKTWKKCGEIRVSDVVYTDNKPVIFQNHLFIDSEVISFTTTHITKYNSPKELPFDRRCLCGHKLEVKNIWITDGFNVLAIGSCCGEKFVAGVKNSCRICDGRINFHPSRKDDLCSECREAHLKKQKEERKVEEEKKEEEFKKQEQERKKRVEEQIEKQKLICRCGKKKKAEYATCYNCLPKCSKCGKSKPVNKYPTCFDCRI